MKREELSMEHERKKHMKTMKNQALTVVGLLTVLSAFTLGPAFGQVARTTGANVFDNLLRRPSPSLRPD